MARTYIVTFFEQAITTANGDYDLFNLTAATDKPIRISRLDLFNKSELGEGQEEGISIKVVRGNATNGSGGATPTPVKFDPGDAAASFTARTCDTAIATAGTAVDLFAGGFNVRASMVDILPSEYRYATTATDGKLCVRLATALADDAVFSGTLWVIEGIV